MDPATPAPAATPSGAVFLSYASEDAEVARRLCEALRAAGIEVWFDQAELRGGDAWDRKIREQIRQCSLFVPLISAHSNARLEGYFRREWKLAVERTHDMAAEKPFLMPVAIDSVPERASSVPEEFLAVQWSRLAQGDSRLVERVAALLHPDPRGARAAAGTPASRSRSRRAVLPWLILAAVLVGAWLLMRIAVPGLVAPKPAAPAASDAGFTPPPHSVAILPLNNMSGDASQDYFADGMSEELINALAQVESLQVIARTSSFAFKGKNVDIGTIARKLNVAAILEGSVRRSGNTVRVTVQLINAVNGYHIWSEDYDRDLKNVLALQTEVATAVTRELRARLLGNEATRIAEGGTDNPQAYDAYLRGSALLTTADDETADRAALAKFDEAIALDPHFAAAHAKRANTLVDVVVDTTDASLFESTRRQAAGSAERAIALAPNWADGYAALAGVRNNGGDLAGAQAPMERALALAPGSARIQAAASALESRLGHAEVAVKAARRAVALDPQSYSIRFNLMQALMLARRFPEALSAAQDATTLNPHGPASAVMGVIYYSMGDMAMARTVCEGRDPKIPPQGIRPYCLALVYHAADESAKAQEQLALMMQLSGDSAATEYAEIYAQWGEPREAMKWLARAEQVHDPALQGLKVDWLLDPLRGSAEFQQLLARMHFPP